MPRSRRTSPWGKVRPDGSAGWLTSEGEQESREPTTSATLNVTQVGREPTNSADLHVTLAKSDLPPPSNLLVARSYASIQAREFRRFSSPRRALKRELRNTIGRAPQDLEGTLLYLIADCDLRAYDARQASKRWGRAYYMLGLPAAILATIAGAAALASTVDLVAVAIVALVSAGLTTAATFLNSNENKQSNNKLSAAWQELADDARLAIIQYGQEVRESEDDKSKRNDAATSLMRTVILFNKRKSALLRGDLTPIPQGTGSASPPGHQQGDRQ
jgi:hypothetical protein